MLKKLKIKTPFKSLKRTPKRWVYKLSIEQVALVFEAGDLSCFDRKSDYPEFITQYNELFNAGDGKKKLNIDRFLLKLYIKHQKLRAMYDSLTTCDAPNARGEFELMFGMKYKSTDDLKLITDLAEQINQKMGGLKPHEAAKEGVSFIELIRIVETSRGINIDRNIKLYEFYGMYQAEMEKWNK